VDIEGHEVKVTAVIWYPTGEYTGTEPFVYVVLH
jgi:hypothetical protein